MSPATSAVAVTASSRALRRELGPTAWAVLEDLVLDAVPDATGRLVAATNVRRLVANLGVSKDAAARALGRLLGRGAVVRLPASRQAGGTFGPIAHLVSAERLEGLVVHGASEAVQVVAGDIGAARPARRQDRLTRARTVAAQAPLFDDLGVAQ